MRTKYQTYLALLGLIFGTAGAVLAQAPQAPGGRGGRGAQDNLVSPEVHADRTVTFRVRAPQATDVTITGDWLATTSSPTGGPAKMTKDDAGVWSFTSPPLEATLHLYFFTVDGMTIADPVNPRIKLRTRTSASLVEVPGDPAPVWQTQNVPHGSVDWNFQHSSVYNDTHEFLVYLPAGYEKGNTRYPVLYLVHGAGDTAVGWTMAGGANVILDNLIAQKKATPMIVVMPFNGGTPAAGRNANSGSSPFEDYMVKELMPFVDAKYRTAPGRKNRAMAGLSAGGAATFNVGLKHLEIFSQFGFFSAAGGIADFATRYPQLAADAKGTNAKIDVFWIACGQQDPLDKAAKDLDASLTKLQIKHTYVDRDGGHVWPVWRWSLAEFAPLLFHKS